MSRTIVEGAISDLNHFNDAGLGEGGEISSAIDNLDEDDLQYFRAGQRYAPALDRIRQVQEEMQRIFASKDEIIRMMVACTIAQTPLVLLGPPGTAKSDLVRRLCDCLGLRCGHDDIDEFGGELHEHLAEVERCEAERIRRPEKPEALRPRGRSLFEYLVTRFTTPEEILGPANIDAMLKLSMYYRESEGMLPSARVAFLDEIFKASSAILNALLSIINERIYYNAGRAFEVNLSMIFAASNESPDTEELAALYDRFPVRVISESVTDEAVEDLLSRSEVLSRKRTLRPLGQADGISPISCVNDFRFMGRVLNVMYGDRGRLFNQEEHRDRRWANEFTEIFKRLRHEFGISDRTPRALAQVAKALALLDGSQQLQPSHLSVFRYCAPTYDTAPVLEDVVQECVQVLKESQPVLV